MFDIAELQLRWWTVADVPALVKLFAACYPDEHWTGTDFQRFVLHSRSGVVNTLKVLAPRATDKPVLGALLFTRRRNECRIRRVAVLSDPAARRRGLGRSMVNTLIRPESLIRCSWFTARVHEHNLTGQLFLRDAFRDPPFRHEAADVDRFVDGTSGYWFRLYRKVWSPRPITAAPDRSRPTA